MKKTPILMIFPLVAMGLLSGCTGMKKPANNASVGVVPSAQTAASRPTISSCTLPSVFTSSVHFNDITQLAKMTGLLKLTSVKIYSQSADLKNILSAAASIKISANGSRDTKLQNICSTGTIAESLPLVLSIHLPSLRITQLDVNDKQDLPATNNPTNALFTANSQGNLSLRNTFKDQGPPYSTNLMLTDWITKLPAQPSISILDDGSVEMRIVWTQNGISTNAYLQFQSQNNY